MITKFEDFLNENDDIQRRLSDRINKYFNTIKSKYPKEKILSDETPISRKEEELPPEVKKKLTKPKLRPEEQKYADKRLDDAYKALSAMGYVDDSIKKFLTRIELEPETTATGIVELGIENFRKLIK